MLSLPKTGTSRDHLLEQMRAMKVDDADWQNGKTFSLVFDPGEEARQLLKEAHNLFFSENGLNPSAFPSLRTMEQQCVSMTAALLNADKISAKHGQAAGNMTSGGTESILLAVKTARDWARKHKPKIEIPQVVLPISAHPAFDKAGQYFGVKMVYTPVADDFRAHVPSMRKAINGNTILVVGSAVQYAQGVVDPITEIAALADEHNVLCHVDACIGGFMLPWVEKLGYPVPAWDFRVPGVTSISCDLHKYAYAAKGASVILYRSRELRRQQFHVYTDWPGGIYASPTMSGTRPGGPIAASWAILNYMGEEGYLAIAKRVMESTRKILAGIQALPQLKVLGKPDMSIVVFSSDKLNVFSIADELQGKGWHLDRHQNPNALHLTISQGHYGVEDEFLADLGAAVAVAGKRSLQNMTDDAVIKLSTGLANVLPDSIFGKLSRAVNNMGADALPKRSAALYGMMAKLPARGEVKELVLDALDKLNSLPVTTGTKLTENKPQESVAQAAADRSESTQDDAAKSANEHEATSSEVEPSNAAEANQDSAAEQDTKSS